MRTVCFTYDQKAVVTCEAYCRVPDDIVAKGDAAIRGYIDQNAHQWFEEGTVTDTSYDEILGKDRYAILGVRPSETPEENQ